MDTGTDEIRDEAARRQAGMRLLSGTMREFAEQTSDYQRLIGIVAQRIGDLIGDVCIVFLLSADKRQLEATSFYDRDEDVAAQYRKLFEKPLSMDDTSIARQVTLSGNSRAMRSAYPRSTSSSFAPVRRKRASSSIAGSERTGSWSSPCACAMNPSARSASYAIGQNPHRSTL
jgi:hypothetical protein